jgi:hypothetical protein
MPFFNGGNCDEACRNVLIVMMGSSTSAVSQGSPLGPGSVTGDPAASTGNPKSEEQYGREAVRPAEKNKSPPMLTGGL